MLDARIPLMGRGFDLQEIAMNAERLRHAQAQRRQFESEAENRKRLGDLLPAAARGDKGAIDQIAGIDPEIFLKMDDRQREQAKAGLADMASAVRWADTPEKWAQVQQYYGGKGVDLTPYGFDKREQGMLMLGKLGEYLETGAKRETVTIDGVVMDKNTGQPLFESPYDRIIAGPNGSFYRVPRMGIGRGGPMTSPDIGGSVQQDAPPPPPGFVIDGGPTPAASGNFPR